MRRGLALYAALAAGVILLLALGLGLVYEGAEAHRAIWLSAAVAFPVQLLAFAIARLMAQAGNGIAGWGAGAGISLLTLMIYGFAVRGLGIPSAPALVSLAAYLFITELIEPPLLNV